MTIVDMFNLGNKFMTEGNMPLAVNMWQEILKSNPEYGPAHMNMAHFLRTQNNPVAEREALQHFLDCPLTGRTIDMLQNVKARIAEIENQLKPQAPK